MSVNRLPNYDYTQKGRYFITISAFRRSNIFGYYKNNQVCYSRAGFLLNRVIEIQKKKCTKIHIDIYNILPNHIHMIICIHEQSEMTISEYVRQIKSFSSKAINVSNNTMYKQNWNRRFYERIITSDQSYQRIFNYIKNNHIKHINTRRKKFTDSQN